MHSLLVYASPERDSSAVATWVGEAVARREKVLVKHATVRDAEVVWGSLRLAGLDLEVLSSGQVELVHTAVVRADTGGRHERLHELHLQQVEQAARDGFTGLAMTGDAAAMHTITRDETELRGYERVIDLLVAEADVRSLCRYSTGERPELLGAMSGVHHRDIGDELWAGAVVGDRLQLRGEIDASNADRFARVVHAGVACGVRALDVSGLRFCAVAGLRALESATQQAHRAGEQLRLVDADPQLVRLLTLTGTADRPGLRLVEQKGRRWER